MNKYVTTVVTIAATTGALLVHGTTDADVARIPATLAAMDAAAAHLALAVVPGAGFGGLSSLLCSCS